MGDEEERQAVGLADTMLLDSPKTKAGIRSIPLPGALVEELRRVKREQDETKVTMGDLYHDYNLVFCQGNGRYLHNDFIGDASRS